MVLTALFWSGAFITGKIAIAEFPPFSLSFFRFLFALPFIFLIFYRIEPSKLWPSKRQWWPLIILGVVGTFGYHALFFTCLKYTTAINSSLIGATNPMMTALLAAVFFHEHLTRLRVVGIALSFAGVFLVVTKGDWAMLTHFQFNPGDILMLIAVLCWAIYSLLGRSFMKKYHLSPLMVTAYTFTVCVVASLPFVWWEQPGSYLREVSTIGWLSVLYMSVFASVLGYLIHMNAVRRIGAAKAAMFINLVPIFTIIQSILILGEAFSLFQFVGACVIIAGVYLATRP
jgi:drug/metabolite transporter (DMT)-like permease